MIADGIAKALAKRDEEQALLASALKAEQDESDAVIAINQSIAEAAAAEAKTGPLYGNQDSKEQYDLRKLLGLHSLPDDKVIALLPNFNTNGKGERTSVDVGSSVIQFFDPGDHENRSKTDKETGSSTYQMLGLEPIVLHKPE